VREITLYSNDSSYGGISFVANYLNANTLLHKSVRKDFDSMIDKIIFLGDKRTKAIFLSTKHLIIFGCKSLKKLLSVLKSNGLGLSRFKKVTLLITDNEFLRSNNFFNKFLLNNSYIDVLIMPDLIGHLDKKISYRPYFQHIPFDDKLVLLKSTNLTISHSPGLKYKSGIKGTPFISRELKGYDLDIIHGESWSSCFRRKSMSHIFIDQMRVDNKKIRKDGPGHAGGLGKSGLEAMLAGSLTITSGKALISEPFFENPPAVFIRPEELRVTVDFFANNESKLKELALKQQNWAKKYLSKQFVKSNILGEIRYD
jgi:hypothetical protein